MMPPKGPPNAQPKPSNSILKKHPIFILFFKSAAKVNNFFVFLPP